MIHIVARTFLANYTISRGVRPVLADETVRCTLADVGCDVRAVLISAVSGRMTSGTPEGDSANTMSKIHTRLAILSRRNW